MKSQQHVKTLVIGLESRVHTVLVYNNSQKLNVFHNMVCMNSARKYSKDDGFYYVVTFCGFSSDCFSGLWSLLLLYHNRHSRHHPSTKTTLS